MMKFTALAAVLTLVAAPAMAQGFYATKQDSLQVMTPPAGYQQSAYQGSYQGVGEYPLNETVQQRGAVASNMLPEGSTMQPAAPLTLTSSHGVAVPAQVETHSSFMGTSRYLPQSSNSASTTVSSPVSGDVEMKPLLRQSDKPLNHRGRNKGVNTATTVEGATF